VVGKDGPTYLGGTEYHAQPLIISANLNLLPFAASWFQRIVMRDKLDVPELAAT
jgi:hypothetical protein